MRKRGAGKSFLAAALCGAATFALDLLVLPRFASGVPDVIWMSLMVLIPVGLALALLGNAALSWVFLGLPVQYVLLILLAGPVSRTLGTPLEGLSAFEFIGQTVIWPPITTLAQFLALWGLKKVKK